jgi:hypothetical protein
MGWPSLPEQATGVDDRNRLYRILSFTSEESKGIHRVMFAVARPQRRSAYYSCRCYKCVREFKAMALPVVAQEFTGFATSFRVNGNALYRAKQIVQHIVAKSSTLMSQAVRIKTQC